MMLFSAGERESLELKAKAAAAGLQHVRFLRSGLARSGENGYVVVIKWEGALHCDVRSIDLFHRNRQLLDIKHWNSLLAMDMSNEHGKPKRMKMSRNVYLPQQTISVILSRLPVKSLLRFRSVCKSWHALISEPYFISCQLQQAKQNPVFIIMPYKRGDTRSASLRDLDLFTYKEEDHQSNFLMKSQLLLERHLIMYPSACDGLVLFFSPTGIHVCNPSTRKITTLPEGSPNKPLTRISAQHVGLGFDTSTKKYKVVRIFYRHFRIRRDFYDMGCEIFEVGSNAWRPADDPPYPVVDVYPAIMDGVLYWVIFGAYKRKSAHILSFDLRSEKFGVISAPPCASEPRRNKFIMPLAGRGGSNLYLAIRSQGSSSLEVWVSKCSSSHDSWVKEFSIYIEHPRRLGPGGIHNGKFLLTSVVEGLYYYNRTRKSIRRVLGIRNKSKPGDDNTWENAYMSFLNGTRGFQVGIYEGSLVSVECS